MEATETFSFISLTLNKPAATWRIMDRVEVKVDLTF
jgi:hypothetical protein